MSELFTSPYFGVGLSVAAFGIGVKLNRKLKTPVCNPLIVAIVIVSGVLLVFDIPYDSYNVGGEIINMFLAPATACLAAAIYTRINILKKYWLPIPKSVTTPIAVSIAEPAGGVVPVTVVAVIGTGILGSILAPYLIRIFRISDPVAAGLAIGASSHAVGTSKAIEIGEVEGAMSGLAIGICGIITVLFSMLVL